VDKCVPGWPLSSELFAASAAHLERLQEKVREVLHDRAGWIRSVSNLESGIREIAVELDIDHPDGPTAKEVLAAVRVLNEKIASYRGGLHAMATTMHEFSEAHPARSQLEHAYQLGAKGCWDLLDKVGNVEE
jgi:hypothetical protein